MAKLIAFLVFMCFEFPRQEAVAIIKKPKNFLLEELTSREEQAIYETYPLNIKLNNKEDFLKSSEEAEQFSSHLKNSWETAEDSKDQMFEDLFEVTFEIEDFMEKASPSMKNFKWLWILEKGSLAKGILPNCSVESVSIFDWESNEDSWLSSGDDNTKLMEEYDKLVLLIEKWMVKAIPKYSNYEWLRIWEKENAANCDYYDSSSYDYYYDIDVRVLSDIEESHKKRVPGSGILKYKRFTSV